MKANYLLKNKPRQSYLKKATGLILVFVIGVTFFSLFDGVVLEFLSPIWKAENIISRNIRESLDLFKSKQTLIDENTSLEEKLASLEIRLASMSEVDQESALLELLGRKPESGIAAGVLTHPPQTPYDILVIDLGSDESINVGAKVFLPEGPILGHVSEVFSHTAKVKLFSTNGEETSAFLERHNISVTVRGVGGGNFKIEVPRDTSVEVGDRILSAGVGTHLLAIVEEVNISPTDSFKEILAYSPANIFGLRIVFVTP